jgi:hypothetical protein
MMKERAVRFSLAMSALAMAAIACGSESSDRSSEALATALTPQQPPEYYVEQANKYFDTLDTSADPNSAPNYSTLVARWELPPWSGERAPRRAGLRAA